MKLKGIEVLQALIDRVESMNYFDYKEKDALVQETKMIIRQLFNSNQDYVNDLQRVRFSPLSIDGNVSMHEKTQSWGTGTRKLSTLLSTMKKELELFNPVLEEKEDSLAPTNNLDEYDSNKVFIVHGHDEAMKLDVARTLETLDLEAVILHEQQDLGLTVIEKFEQNAVKCNFAIVLLSPDDKGTTKDGGPDTEKFRARQNVVLELGYFIGRLGRSRVLPLVKNPPTGSLEIPSDYAGVVYTPYDAEGAWKMKLFQYLLANKYEVDANRLFK